MTPDHSCMRHTRTRARTRARTSCANLCVTPIPAILSEEQLLLKQTLCFYPPRRVLQEMRDEDGRKRPKQGCPNVCVRGPRTEKGKDERPTFKLVHFLKRAQLGPKSGSGLFGWSGSCHQLSIVRVFRKIVNFSRVANGS